MDRDVAETDHAAQVGGLAHQVADELNATGQIRMTNALRVHVGGGL